MKIKKYFTKMKSMFNKRKNNRLKFKKNSKSQGNAGRGMIREITIPKINDKEK